MTPINIRWLPEEEQKLRNLRIVKLRDEHKLTFTAIGERENLSAAHCRRIYTRIKNNIEVKR